MIGTSLVVQWLRLCPLNARGLGAIPGEGTRSHVLQLRVNMPKLRPSMPDLHEIKTCLLLGRKVLTNLDSIFKSRDINLPRKVHLVQAMVFLVVKGCG